MKTRKVTARRAIVAAAACMIATLAAPSFAADPLPAELINVWTGAGERVMLKVLADGYDAAGGKFVNTPVPTGNNVMAMTVNRIVGGNPPTSSQFAFSRIFDDLLKKGQLADIDDVARAEGWAKVLPKEIMDGISFNGKVYLSPVDITSMNRLYYNIPVLKKAGVEKAPTDLNEDFFAALDKLKASGVIPLALGGNAGQYRWTWDAVMSAVGGKDHWLAVYVQRDPKAMKDATQRKVFETYRRLSKYIDKGSPGRAWQATTNLVISGQAGMQILGDWGKAEFVAAGKKPGVDFGCGLPGGIFVMTGDVLAFPKQKSPEAEQAQKLLAKVSMAPKIQLEFNIKHGSIPPRTDVKVAGNPDFDQCVQTAAATYGTGANVVRNSALILSPDAMGSVVDLVSEYFNTDMPTDQALDRFAAILTSGK
ncbi:MAG TPA: ABC transporter substrate-binding protein [Ramlibacter sp.]|uniref:ABC transporter substrate-binding protein n=1 Tax=Ramlibacter sp. TaxID=1917967 RepID=UPI002BB02242|nr:ABC transporter substrate-binding protein [Ramlibacter sp.]HVZ45847.1 ABC transporter substrate-binding protein [Ramlibacter sp.]